MALKIMEKLKFCFNPKEKIKSIDNTDKIEKSEQEVNPLNRTSHEYRRLIWNAPNAPGERFFAKYYFLPNGMKVISLCKTQLKYDDWIRKENIAFEEVDNYYELYSKTAMGGMMTSSKYVNLDDENDFFIEEDLEIFKGITNKNSEFDIVYSGEKNNNGYVYLKAYQKTAFSLLIEGRVTQKQFDWIESNDSGFLSVKKSIKDRYPAEQKIEKTIYQTDFENQDEVDEMNKTLNLFAESCKFKEQRDCFLKRVDNVIVERNRERNAVQKFVNNFNNEILQKISLTKKNIEETSKGDNEAKEIQ